MNYELIYIGKGKGILQGIPARNLTRVEIEASGLTAEKIIASGLYMRPVVDLQPDDVYKIMKRVRKTKDEPNQESE
jgi:hypothetical protein